MADRRLQVFHAVAKHRSFTKAAETLFMTQPAVTFQIKQLEEQFNVRLFERGHGQISLTDAGQVVFDYADRYKEGAMQMAQWIAAGKLKAREDVVEGGIDAFPETLLKLFKGENFGKLVLAL